MSADLTAAEFPMPRMWDIACAGDCGRRMSTFVDPTAAGAKPQRCAKCLEASAHRRDRTARLFALERSIPDAYEWATLDADLRGFRERTEQRKRAARAHCSTALLTFIGPAGSGKTTLAVAMLRERARATGEGGLFVHAHRLEGCRRKWGLGDGDPPDYDAAVRAPVLLLDDVGIGDIARSGSPVAEVIRERHAARRATWCTTGLGVDGAVDQAAARAAVAKAYNDDGTARRMFDREEGVVVLDLGKAAAPAPIVQRDAKPANPGAAFDPRRLASGDNT